MKSTLEIVLYLSMVTYTSPNNRYGEENHPLMGGIN